MGYTMRTDRYRYTEWVAWNGSSLTPLWDRVEARELYDHKGDDGPWTDPDSYENANLAERAPKGLVSGLSAQLRGAFREGA